MKEEDGEGEMEPANSVSMPLSFFQSHWKHWKCARAVHEVQVQHTFIPK